MSRETSISEPTGTTRDSGPASARLLFGAALAGVFVLAVAVRLTGVRRGAGLYGLGNYDDGVHFAAALGARQ